MADNIVLNPGVGGATISTDDLGAGLQVQRVKAQFGGNGVATDVALTDPLPTRSTGATSTLSNTVSNAGSVTVLASAAGRLRAWLYNDADKPCYVKYGAGATTASFTKKLLPGEFFVVEGYTGIIDAIWDAGPTGSMRATELTA